MKGSALCRDDPTGGYAGSCRGRSLPNQRTVQARQMPWLTFGAPGRMTCLHQAHTRVGRRRAALMALFMIGRLDSMRAGMFRQFLGKAAWQA